MPPPPPPPPPDDDPDAGAGTCSDTRDTDGTTEDCPLRQKAIVTLTWENSETWCSEDGGISGTTRNYTDGETLTVDVKGRPDNDAVHSFADCQVSGDGFGHPWDVIDVLPIGGPSWQDRRELIGGTGGVETPDPMIVRFIPNVTRTQASHSVQYQKQDTSGAWGTASVECLFELEVRNYLLVIHGVIKYVRGWGREVLKLADASLGGGFLLYSGETYHWGYRDAASGTFKYWDGSAFVATPAAWVPSNTNHFGAAFYDNGGTQTFLDNTSLSWPQTLPEWPANLHTGSGNLTDTTLATWTNQINTAWTDKFDIERVECQSTLDECCRYKTHCIARFEEVDAFGAHVIIVVYDDVRSHALMWSMADTRPGLAPHEFGHHLGAPDEYSGQGTTQVGVNDTDGLVSGVDANSMMGSGMNNVKKRHYKGIIEVLAQLVSDQFSKTYTYQAVAKGTTLASPIDTPVAPPGSSGSSNTGMIVGAIIGAIVGAVVGAIIGFVASGGNPGAAVAGALIGATAGALAGAGIGSLF